MFPNKQLSFPDEIRSGTLSVNGKRVANNTNQYAFIFCEGLHSIEDCASEQSNNVRIQCVTMLILGHIYLFTYLFIYLPIYLFI